MMEITDLPEWTKLPGKFALHVPEEFTVRKGLAEGWDQEVVVIHQNPPGYHVQFPLKNCTGETFKIAVRNLEGCIAHYAR